LSYKLNPLLIQSKFIGLNRHAREKYFETWVQRLRTAGCPASDFSLGLQSAPQGKSP